MNESDLNSENMKRKSVKNTEYQLDVGIKKGPKQKDKKMKKKKTKKSKNKLERTDNPSLRRNVMPTIYLENHYLFFLFFSFK